jgi:aldose 1-epimerase
MHPEQQLSIARNSEGATSMAVISQVGGALDQLSLKGVPIIDSSGVQGIESMFFGSVLAPWPNRLANHSYSFSGQTYLTPNIDADNNSNHGLIFNRQLELVAHLPDRLELAYQFGEDESYPFDVRLSITYEIFEDLLRVTALADNLGKTAPFGLGFHPYFLAGENFRVSANFTKKIIANDKMIPTSQIDISGFEYVGGAIDDCFAGAKQALLETDHASVTMSLEKGFEYFMLFRPNDAGKSLLAIEPMSCLANAFNSDLPSVILEAGAKKEYAFSIRMH